MVSKPPRPDGYSLPAQVNGWCHAPDSKKNGHIWLSPEETAAVGVFGFGGEMQVKLLDERVSGIGRSKAVFEAKYQHTKDYYEPADSSVPMAVVVETVEAAVDWMQRHAPPWEHPAVEPAAFDPPAGFVLDRYYLEERQQTVCYRQEGTESDVNMSGRPPDTEPSLDTRKYLYVEAWRGSGNATVALAPWLRAHDDEKHEVLEPPAECGLDVALMLAREWVADQRNTTVDHEQTAGQASLGGWT